MSEKETKFSVKHRITMVSDELKVQKTGHNSYAGYYYLTPEDILNPLKALLNKHRLFKHFDIVKEDVESNFNIITEKTTEIVDGKEVVTERTESKPIVQQQKEYAILTISDVDSDEAQVYKMRVEDIALKGANALQSIGGTRTYCERYLLMTAFSIADNTSDLDASDTLTPPEKEDPLEKARKELMELCKEKSKVLGTEFVQEKMEGKKVADLKLADVKKMIKIIGSLEKKETETKKDDKVKGENK